MDRMRMYDIIYALAAKDSRETALFGNCAPCAREALSRSLAGEKLPEIWLEVPLSGDPWFDIHALTAYEDVAGTQAAFAGQGGSYADALAWFAAQPPMTVRQLALSYDTHAGDVDHPAVQLLVCGRDESVPLGFLEAIGLSSAKPSYRTFAHNMPKEWFACYIGAFPRRQATDPPPWVRVECLVGKKLQRAYAENAETFLEDLARIGLKGIDKDAAANIQELARSPFPLEFQFNIGPDGAALPIISSSVRLQPEDWTNQTRKTEIRRLMCWIQDRGLADGRWEQLEETLFGKRVTYGDDTTLLVCFPAFVKLRWRADQQPDAKAYLKAFAQ